MKKSKLLLISFGVILGVAMISAKLLLKVYHIPTRGMEPTYMADSYVLCSKLFKRDNVATGDVIVFSTKNLKKLHYQNSQESVFIKRVAATAGDEVNLNYGILTINGVEVGTYDTSPALSAFEGSHVVGEDELFVMGDNQEVSLDSKYFGMVPLSDVIYVTLTK